MTKESYRKSLNNNTVYAENEDVETETEFLMPEDVDGVLDDVEDDVNEILGKLEPIEGIAETDEIKEAVRTLAERLY